MLDWQPMDTVPKGIPVLVLLDHFQDPAPYSSRIQNAYFDDDFSLIGDDNCMKPLPIGWTHMPEIPEHLK